MQLNTDMAGTPENSSDYFCYGRCFAMTYVWYGLFLNGFNFTCQIVCVHISLLHVNRSIVRLPNANCILLGMCIHQDQMQFIKIIRSVRTDCDQFS